MVRLVGFFRALRSGSLRGDVGSEKCCLVSMLPEVAGLGMMTLLMLIVRFFGFLFGFELTGDSDWVGRVKGGCSEVSV